jgi:DinB superfamily
MNRMMNEKWPWIEAAHGMRSQLLDLLSDADLTFHPGGQNMAFGALCRQMGETEHAYTQSLQTLKHEWSYRNTEADLVSSIARLKAWFQTLDDQMQAAIAAFSDEDGKKTVDRGGEAVTGAFQLDVYVQAVLIFSDTLSGALHHTGNRQP